MPVNSNLLDRSGRVTGHPRPIRIGRNTHLGLEWAVSSAGPGPQGQYSGVRTGRNLFIAIAYALDPIFHRVGLAMLTAPALTGMWTGLYNTEAEKLETTLSEQINARLD